MTRILYKRGMIKTLAAQFNCTEQTVRNALRGATEGEQPERIRKEALKQGCREELTRVSRVSALKYESWK